MISLMHGAAKERIGIAPYMSGCKESNPCQLRCMRMNVPDHTTASAAQYLAERGYTVRSKRDGTEQAPRPDTIKHWCERGKIKGRKVSSRLWLIAEEELEKLVKKDARDTANK
jgi:hypothetical protein